MADIIIHCLFDGMLPVSELLQMSHPKNRNKHPDEQIARLAKIFVYQGIRHAVKISRQSGKITTGHGRVLAARHLGLEAFPVVYQNYSDMDQEIADINADNAIARWAEFDMAGLNADMADLGPDFDVEMLGLKRFEIDPSDLDENLPDEVEPDFRNALQVDLKSEEETAELYEELKGRGFTVKVLSL